MKKFNELTVDEIANLSKEEVEMYIDYLCAERGLPLIPPKPEPVTPTKIEETEPYYYISIGYDTLFTEEDAKDIVEYINKKKIFSPVGVDGYGTPEFVTKRDTSTSVYLPAYNRKLYYTEEKARLQHEINRKEKLAVEKAKREAREYEQALKDRESAEEEILNAVQSAIDEVEKRNLYILDWKRYLELAENNSKIARSFFENRYSQSIFEEIKEFIGYTED